MGEPKAYSYATMRVVPRVDREEFLNVGVILFSAELRFLAARVLFEEERLRSLWPTLDLYTVRRHLDTIPRICAAEAGAGAIAGLAPKQRFYWLTAPRSTVVQVSPVRSGLTEDPAASLEHLMRELVSQRGD